MNRFIYSCILWIEPCFLDNSHFTFFFPSFFYASFALLQRYEFRLTWKHRRLMGEEEKRMRVSITTCRFKQENKVSSKSTFTTYYAHCIRFQFFFFQSTMRIQLSNVSIKNGNWLEEEENLPSPFKLARIFDPRERFLVIFSTPSTRRRKGRLPRLEFPIHAFFLSSVNETV